MEENRICFRLDSSNKLVWKTLARRISTTTAPTILLYYNVLWDELGAKTCMLESILLI
jgi:hypothetical protein